MSAPPPSPCWYAIHLPSGDSVGNSSTPGSAVTCSKEGPIVTPAGVLVANRVTATYIKGIRTIAIRTNADDRTTPARREPNGGTRQIDASVPDVAQPALRIF